MTTRIAPGVGANLIGQHSAERNQDATSYVGNLDPQVTEELLWELFVQAGPVVNVYVPKDRVTNLHQGYGFVEFRSEEDADYASQDKKSLDVGANLFIGNLDPDVDEKLLYDTFSAFGVIVTNPKIMRDPETGNSRGFGFISYDSFEASDAAIEAMNGQYLCNRQITASYAYKKDTKGERHGTPAERVLAASNPGVQKSRPHTLFASGPPTLPNAPQANGTMTTPIPPRPFANGSIPPPAPLAPLRPPTQGGVFPPMPMSGPPSWQGLPQQPGQATPPPSMPPPHLQHFRPPPSSMPPPPPQGAHAFARPPPPPTGMAVPPPYWRPPPPPQHLARMHPSMQQMSIPPPPPPASN
ncbi:RNA-binding (RRM/RBD/RNP motifs) family protein [Actinidia rufa]|uniref:Splicing factor 3B subunit 4 n=1 Tax=Actinidia rufa TaxID=165716 RepID=A0A7J0GJC4_9ERIC|nr:RNA-binding (RRM/RBD/RNP motifs) family protein [Actinidia rufa]